MTEKVLSADLDKIASRVAEKLDNETVELADLLDGLKALTAYYVARSKRTSENNEEKVGNGSFAALKRRVHEAEKDSGGDQEIHS